MTATDLEIIDAYLDGALQGDKKETFERRLASDPDLVRAVEEQRTLRKVAFQYGQARQTVDALHARLQEKGFFDRADQADEDFDSRPPRSAPRSNPFWKIVFLIFVAILGGIGYYLYSLAHQSVANKSDLLSIPYMYRESRMVDVQVFLQNNPQFELESSIFVNRYRAAMTAIERRLANPVTTPQEMMEHYHAALICLYALENCDPASAVRNMEAALPHVKGSWERMRFQETYMVALVRTGQYAKAKEIYNGSPGSYFAGFPGVQYQLKHLPEE